MCCCVVVSVVSCEVFVEYWFTVWPATGNGDSLPARLLVTNPTTPDAKARMMMRFLAVLAAFFSGDSPSTSQHSLLKGTLVI